MKKQESGCITSAFLYNLIVNNGEGPELDYLTELELPDVEPQRETISDIAERIPIVEIESGKVMVKMELTRLYNGMEIPQQIWEPLFGGEQLRKELWDKLLPEPGNELIIKGSGTSKIYGGYVLDRNTGLASPEYRSDIDIEIYQPDMIARLDGFEGKQLYVAKSFKIGEIDCDVAIQPRIREMLLNELELLEKQVKIYPDGDPMYNQFPHFVGYAEQIEFLKSFLEKDYQTEMNFLINTFMPNEALGLKMVREQNGELKVTLIDVQGFLTDITDTGESDYAGALTYGKMGDQLSIQSQLQEHMGFMFQNQNPFSAYQLFIEAGGHMSNIFYENDGIPYYTATEITRMIRAACELKIYTNGSPNEFNYSGRQKFWDIYRFAYRLSHNDNPFLKKTHEYGTDLSAEANQKELNEDITLAFQKDFARAALANTNEAFWYMLAYLPMGKYVSEELNKQIEELHTPEVQKIIPPNNDLELQLEGSGIGPDSKIEDLPGRKAIHILLEARRLIQLSQEQQVIKMQGITDNTEEHPMYQYVAKNPPESMSEVISYLLVAAKWDPEKDKDKIEGIVKDWKPTGKLKHTWTIHKASDFELAMKTEDIIRHMERLTKIKEAESPSL